MSQQIRVLVVDDSAVIRGLFERALKADGTIDVVGTAGNGQIAINMLKNTQVDVLVLDIEMPVMDGLEALPEILKIAPAVKVIMASTLTKRNADISIRAMQLGAADYIPKPSSRDGNEVEEFYQLLITKVKALVPHIRTSPNNKPTDLTTPLMGAAASGNQLPSPIPKAPREVRQLSQPLPAQALAIASSTGGPQALLQVFRDFKGVKPRVPIFITQHMPANFTAILADHIAKACDLDCHEAVDGEDVLPGKIYLAPGDFHMTIHRDGTRTRLKLDKNPPENFCRPSADPMFRSLAKVYGDKLTCAVLTGLGSDGARGAWDVVNAGGNVIAQDEATSVVYGMPKATADAKLTSGVFPLDKIAPYLIKAVT